MDNLNAFILDNFLLIAAVIIVGAIIAGVALRIKDWLKGD